MEKKTAIEFYGEEVKKLLEEEEVDRIERHLSWMGVDLPCRCPFCLEMNKIKEEENEEG